MDTRRARCTVLLLVWLVGGSSGAALAATAGLATAPRAGGHDDAAPRRSRPAVLPFGASDPRAVTEAFLAQHEDVALSPQHLAILTLEPTDGSVGDTGTEEGVDEVRYAIKHKTRLDLRVHPSADQVGRVVLKDRHGRELARHERGTPATSMRLRPGGYVLAVHHVSPGDPQAPTRTVFVRPFAATSTDGSGGGAVAAIEVSQDCVSCDFSNSDLTGHDFSGFNLSGSVFSGATLTRVRFAQAVMAHCDFHSRAFLQWTHLEGTDFSDANLTSAKFDMVFGRATNDGPGGIFVRATLDSTTWGPIQPEPHAFVVASAHLEGANFSYASLKNAVFNATALDEATFEGATLDGADFRTTGIALLDNLSPPWTGNNTSCSDCVFAKSVISNTHFEGAFLEGATFEDARLTKVTFDDSWGTGQVDFSGVSFAGIDLSRLDLSSGQAILSATTSFANAILSDGIAHGVNLAGQTFPDGTSEFKGQNLAFTNLKGVRLFQADLSGATLSHADLSGAILTEANLAGATLTSAVLVSGFLDFTNLRHAVLDGVQAGVAPGSGVRATTFKGAFMPGVDLTDADLRSADLSDAHIYADVIKPSLLLRTKLDSADLSGAILSEAALSGSFNDTTFNKAVLVNSTFNGADLTNAKFDDAYLQGGNFTGATSVEGASFQNAAFSTSTACLAGGTEAPPCTWHFTEHDGTPVIVAYGATVLWALAADASVLCPDGEDGPCTLDKLTPISGGPFPPVPACVPAPPKYCNCIPVDQGGCKPS